MHAAGRGIGPAGQMRGLLNVNHLNRIIPAAALVCMLSLTGMQPAAAQAPAEQARATEADHAQMMQVLADEEIDEEIYGRLRRRNMRQSGTLTEQELALMRTADTVRTIRQMLREEGLVSPDLPERFKWLDT